MWLRSDSTSPRRSRRCSLRTTTITPNSILTLSRRQKPGKSIKFYPASNNNNNNNNACTRKSVGTHSKLIKCNTTSNPTNARAPPMVKRLTAVRNRPILSRPKSRNTEKENIWKDSNEITLYEQCANNVCQKKSQPGKDSGLGPPNDELNSFGPISLARDSCSKERSLERRQFEVSTSTNSNNCNNEPVSTTDLCTSEIQTNVEQSDHPNHQERAERQQVETSITHVKCVTECDSTTDYIQSTIHTIQMENTRTLVSLNEGGFSSQSGGEGSSTMDIVVPEVDSTTTDILASVDGMGQSVLATYPSCNYASKYDDSATSTISDLMSLFPEEELAKSTSSPVNPLAASSSSSPHHQFSSNDLMPHYLMCSSALTQDFLNCNEPSHLCDNTDQLSQPHAIENLKALTNLPTHPTNLFSSLNFSRCGGNEVNSLITNISSNSYDHNHGGEVSVYCYRPSMCDSGHEDEDENRMDTDTDCPEIEEMPETRQDETALDTFDPYLFIKRLPPPTVEMRAKCPALPLKTRSSPEFSLVLDLDETLVHCSLQELSDASFKFPVLFQDYKYTVFVRTRPFFREFLEQVSKRFEVILFTASKRVYADKLLNLLDPERKWIKYRLFREHCVLVNGNYIKDLTILGRDLSKTIIIDNSPQAFGYQLENGIPIESWFMDQNDSELMKILPFLEQLATLREDVRPHIREKYRLFSYLPPD